MRDSVGSGHRFLHSLLKLVHFVGGFSEFLHRTGGFGSTLFLLFLLRLLRLFFRLRIFKIFYYVPFHYSTSSSGSYHLGGVDVMLDHNVKSGGGSKISMGTFFFYGFGLLSILESL